MPNGGSRLDIDSSDDSASQDLEHRVGLLPRAAAALRSAGGSLRVHAQWVREVCRARFARERRRSTEEAYDEDPLRSELYSIVQLERHAKTIAGLDRIGPRGGRDRLLARLRENERVLDRAYQVFTASAERQEHILPAAEWLLDNFYIVKENVRSAYKHLPPSYSRELPRLADGPAAGMPRVYSIALQLVTHVSGKVDEANLDAFAAAYQSVQPLTLGELWAMPIMLRLALIENLRCVAVAMATSERERDMAAQWAERMAAVVEQNPNDLILVLAELAKSDPPMTAPFVAELIRHLHGHSPHFGFALSWLDHRLADQGLRIATLVQAESHRQAVDHVAVGNCVTSLRAIGVADWRGFVERQSIAEQILRGDPAGVYAQMDFATRDYYRHAVEAISKGSRATEYEVARHAVRLASEAAPVDASMRARHVGYYLIDAGRPQFERALGMHFDLRRMAEFALRRKPLLLYIFAMLICSVGVGTGLALWSLRSGIPAWPIALLMAPAAMCLFQAAMATVNWLLTLCVPPRPMPRLDFSAGIPPEHAAIVVVPAFISSPQAVEHLLERLELHYIANRDANLRFALLSDFTDAREEHMPDDDALLHQAEDGIKALNAKYTGEGPGLFYLFHRPRRYNAKDKLWLGYERKRGKLKEFNALLRGEGHDRFSSIVGDTGVLRKIPYVITLDADTQLPGEAARKLVGAKAHPLNVPVVDATRGRVVAGYGILQPRVGVNLSSARRSWFVRIFSTEPGIDPYTRMVSDVYQDVFGEGSFIGKGIYDAAVFEQVTAVLPDNTVLSHDLIESAYARSALLNDVELFEEYPSVYFSDVQRRHRWVRGDWQILWWLLPRVPSVDTAWIPNGISALSWFKIFDNHRRSLVPAAMLLLFVAGWALLPPAAAAIATLLAIAPVATGPFLGLLQELLQRPVDLPRLMHLRSVGYSLARHGTALGFTLVFLPFEAQANLDAVLRSLVRMLVTRRRLLEWTTHSDAERGVPTDLGRIFLRMWIAPGVAAATLACIGALRPENLPLGIPFAGAWILSPIAAWWIGRSAAARPPRLNEEERLFLRRVARRTWRYFETFVTQEENWLPPDNVQEHPAAAVASRTSPTNIGMALLANLSAYDFGYLCMGQLLQRTQATLDAMTRMERYQGHLYNWYDTRTLAPLHPNYVSTVDSGNLALHLETLRQGLLELEGASIVAPRLFDGLRDTLGVLREIAARNDRRHVAEQAGRAAIAQLLNPLERELSQAPGALSAIAMLLQRVAAGAAALCNAAPAEGEVKWWAAAFERQVLAHLDDLTRFAPWTHLSPPLPVFWQEGSADQARVLNELRDAMARMETPPALREVAALGDVLIPRVDDAIAAIGASESRQTAAILQWAKALRGALSDGEQSARDRINAIEYAADACRMSSDMDFRFLYDRARSLFAIGYNASTHRLDNSYYDLLASEARVSSFFAIAEGQIEQEHWFMLGRLLTVSAGAPALLSWSGSMFEYLMPMLVMPSYEGTLLDQTMKSVVQCQRRYARRRRIPWGISESGFYAWDRNLAYQYRAFGVPGLGLKRGLADDLVVAPYATAMALMVAPEAACRNLQRLSDDGRLGPYGFYEAIDYTPSRVPPGLKSATVRQFMGHHEGMALLGIAYVLLNQPMQRRFSMNPAFRANELLLQERIPRASPPIFSHAVEPQTLFEAAGGQDASMRVLRNPGGPMPEVHLLSNGHYHVMLSSAGGGFSRWRDLAVTRWHEDPTRDCWGSFCYLRDIDHARTWSNTHQPMLKTSNNYEAIFTQAKVEFRRNDDQIETHTEIGVSAEDDIELRRITITNHSEIVRTIEATSYAETVLAQAAQDAAHPAFSNMFVKTEILRAQGAILSTRRPRGPGERPPWLLHAMSVQGELLGKFSYETDRVRFIGRGRTTAEPAAMDRPGRLSDTEGTVLDPIMSIRCTLRLAPNSSVTVDLLTGVTETREAATALVEKYREPRLADRIFELAWTHSHVELRNLNVTPAEALVFGRLAGSVLYASQYRRANPQTLTRNRRGQSALWGYGISGDLPIVLARIHGSERIDFVRQLISAHAYWRSRGLLSDLILRLEDDSVYRQDLQDTIVNLIAASPDAGLIDRPGGIFIRRIEQIPEDDLVLMQAVARVVLDDGDGTLREQAERRYRSETAARALAPVQRRVLGAPVRELPKRDLAFFNGLGGFTQDGREYVIVLRPGQNTPAPWCNVIANTQFGTLLSESGSVYTWADNSHEYRITPWHGDPIGASGEAIYIRDEESGRFWSPTPAPARGATSYVARHGFGYSVYEHNEDGVETELFIYVGMDTPVKFARLKVANRSGRTRRLSVTGYWELVLGEQRAKMHMHIVTEADGATGAIFARNPFHAELGGNIVFFDVSETNRSITGDRGEFLGRNGSPANPAALYRVRLSGRVGAALDPCAALQAALQLGDGQEREVVFTMGSAAGEEQARQLVQRTRGSAAAQTALEGVWTFWNRTLGAVYVESPDAALNYLANGWLIYQALSCRLWARTGFYQSGGAFGFRDQLQDALSMVYAQPQLLRAQILRAAAHQFREGDVQHWWHEPSGRGLRSHCSDDYLWLPFALCRYIRATGDTGVLDEQTPFLEGRAVRPDEEGYYDLPQVSGEAGSIYEHCVRAIARGLRFGAHGLPLMGSCDWNDGMNLVGTEGRGESVWLGFFLYDVLMKFKDIAAARGDETAAQTCTDAAQTLREKLEHNAWDGAWYRRAYFDNGNLLGSAENTECQIDSLPQSWAVLSGAGDATRAKLAMDSVYERLVQRDAKLIQLFDPPFDKPVDNPGYICGYPPGVRENGGQYTHAAIWAVMATAALGDAKRAWEMFSLINPIRHGATPEDTRIYKVEPYVIAADVYSVSPYAGRGGWTWYTGSASWLYRLIVESLLGLRLENTTLHFAPCLPPEWKELAIHYRHRDTCYHIRFHLHGGGQNIRRLILDQAEQQGHALQLVDDHADHHVEIELA